MINPLLTEPFESKILELIETSDEFTTSDLQGVVTVLVNKIMERGHEILKESE